jgi:hypothetical protein
MADQLMMPLLACLTQLTTLPSSTKMISTVVFLITHDFCRILMPMFIFMQLRGLEQHFPWCMFLKLQTFLLAMFCLKLTFWYSPINH